ncbi:MAG: TonB family protein [Gammaproteobacteria bacterium]|jgi:protein TonB
MKLYQAIIISLLCHSILVLPLAEQPMPEVAIAPIQVSLGDNHQTPQHSSTSQKQAPRDTKQVKPVENKQVATVNSDAHNPASHNNTEKSETSNDGNMTIKKETTSQQQAQNYVLSRLHSEIDNYFLYPLLAQRNGWQGKVILGLSVTSRGGIKNVHIKEGSGYKVLDQSALDTLLKIKQIKNTGDWIVLDNLDIIIPIIYRLQKG